MTREEIIAGINRAAADGNQRVVMELGALLRQVSPAGPSVMDEQVSPMRALAAGIGEGGSFGWRDEIQGRMGAGADQGYQGLRAAGAPEWLARPAGFITGGIPGLFQGGEEADFLTNASRDEMTRAREQHPGLAYGGEVAGALATGVATGNVLAPAANAGRLAQGARYAMIGGTEGTLYGAGAGDDNRMAGALMGGGLGVGFSIAAPVAMAAAKMTWPALKRALGAADPAVNARARKLLSEIAEREGVTPEDVVQTLRDSWVSRSPQDAPMTLADVSDVFRGGLATGLTGARKEAREAAVGFYSGRGRDAAGRLDEAAQGVLGVRGQTHAGTMAGLRQQAQEMGEQEYRAMFRGEGAQGVAVPDWLEARMRNSPLLREAWDRADQLLAAQGNEVPGNAARLHEMKKYLSKKARSMGSEAESATFKQNAAEISEYLGEKIPGYTDLSARRADLYQIEEAAELGRNLFTGRRSIEQIEGAAALQGDELEAFKIGIRDALRQRSMDAGGDPKRMLNGKHREMLRKVFGDDGVKELLDQVDYEAGLMRTQSVAETTMAQLGQNPDLTTGGMLATLGMGQKVLLAAQVLGRLRALSRYMSPEDHGALVDLLTKKVRTAEDAAIMIEALTPLANRYFGAAGGAAAMGGATTSGVLAMEE